MSIKRLSVLLLVMVLAMLVSACAGCAGSPRSTGRWRSRTRRRRNHHAHMGLSGAAPEEAASHEQAGAAFMAEHPEITLEYWNQPRDDYFTKIQALRASGDTATIPDVAFLWPTPLRRRRRPRKPRPLH